MKLKIKITSLLFLGFFIFSFHGVLAKETLNTNSHTDDAEYIKDFNAFLDIKTNGIVDVTEKIVYNFGSVSKHGIYRYIPVVFKNSTGTLKTRIANVTVSDEAGNSQAFVTSTSGDNFNIQIGDDKILITGTRTYVINYSISKVISFFNNHDELYWNVTGNGWPVGITNVSATVKLPGQVQAKDIKVTCFAGLAESTRPCKMSQGQNSESEIGQGRGLAIFSQGNLESYAGLTIVVGFPKGLVIKPTLWQNIQQIILDNWIVSVPILAFILMFWLWWNKGRDPKTSSVVVAEYEAPEGLTPGEMAELVSFSADPKGTTAEIIQLAVMGYLKINRVETKFLLSHGSDYELIQLKTSDSLKKEHQKTLMDGLFKNKGTLSSLETFESTVGTGVMQSAVVGLATTVFKDDEGKKSSLDSVMLSGLRDVFYKTLRTVNAQITKSLIALGYFDKDPVTVKIYYVMGAVFIGVISFFVASILGVVGLLSLIVTALVVLLFGLVMPRRTSSGAEMLRIIMGLKLYLNVAEKDRINFHNAPDKTPERFEKLLPYAIALGVETEWAKQFDGIYIQPPSWYGANYSTFNTLILVNSLHDFHSSAASTLSSSPSSRASSGGSGFSGGSSGGGFGGGGGGSW